MSRLQSSLNACRFLTLSTIINRSTIWGHHLFVYKTLSRVFLLPPSCPKESYHYCQLINTCCIALVCTSLLQSLILQGMSNPHVPANSFYHQILTLPQTAAFPADHKCIHPHPTQPSATIKAEDAQKLLAGLTNTDSRSQGLDGSSFRGGSSTVLQPSDPKQAALDSLPQAARLSLPQVIYASRTHGQLAQVVRELRNTSYK